MYGASLEKVDLIRVYENVLARAGISSVEDKRVYSLVFKAHKLFD